MPNTTIGGAAVCPYFINVYETEIRCEVKGYHVKTPFENEDGVRAYARAYCTTDNCENCETYKKNVQKVAKHPHPCVERCQGIDCGVKYLRCPHWRLWFKGEWSAVRRRLGVEKEADQ